ncbi:hypothetical protein FOXG_09158 [Fusarium oxysporum f. sp. lycopersici 4287]|uniref:DUF7924 domain-containing protein n=2 Tax=Fusarium oxysporum TaxID=5507 RepID=A0A0J9VAM3_FUSO4|nr:hypothetical protein FOXG_09158 [Fusarium oxysporum f. sp. lycopersici 4287]EXK37096.1 hypothetical protein FOMG_07964 [Fusarium oxysporum f. sp. melonis 26406]KNB08173.1 hypothetical protein FOXG_09158 [Fusarium oxysporum f. sp. lycopersici 4287]
MEGSQEPAPIQASLDNPRKRAASRSPSIPPPQAQQFKRSRYEVDNQDTNDHVMFQPAPIRSILPSAALLGYIKETQPRPSYLEKVDNWLEDTYPSDLRKTSRSDCFILDKDFEPILLERSHSAPAIMSGRKNLTGQAVTFELAGAVYRPDTNYLPTATGTPNRSNGPLVESALYRDCNLALNNILLLDSRTELPPHISTLVESLKKGRSSPEPIPQDNDDLYDMEAGASEAKVEDFVRNNVIPLSSGIDKIKRSDRVFVGRAIIPITNPYARISVPVPDLLYGYRLSAFEQDQRMQIATCGNFAFANSEGLTFPFFAVEFKGDGPSSKDRLEKCTDIESSKPLDSTSFSVAMNGTEARLHVSWKDGEFIYTQKIKTFILQRPEEFLEFRRFVRNIIDWGRDERLECIKSGLDVLIEEREMATLKNKLSRPRSKSGGSAIRLQPY